MNVWGGEKKMKQKLKQYATVLTHMEHLATTSFNSDVKGRAKFTTKAMKAVSFVCFCHFLADLFDVLSKLSVQFQWNELIPPCVGSLSEGTLSNVTLLFKWPVLGGRLHTFLSGLQACNGSFMFQGIILSGDASGLIPVEITHANGVHCRDPDKNSYRSLFIWIVAKIWGHAANIWHQ